MICRNAKCKAEIADTPFCPHCGTKQEKPAHKPKARGNGTRIKRIINSDTFFRISEMSEPYNAIIMTKEFLEQTEHNMYYYKWAIIAAHNALQGFFVLALKGTSNLPILKWHKKYRGKSSFEILSDSDQKLCSFLNLLDKFNNSEYVQGIPIIAIENITNALNDLNYLRNTFVHFLPHFHSIEIQHIMNVLKTAMKEISLIFDKCNDFTRYYSDYQFREIKRTLEDCESILLSYESN